MWRSPSLITLDGTFGEGGGQILRTALSLSVLTGKAFRLDAARARRDRPGLRRQHVTAVHAASEISGGEAEGAEIDSRSVAFYPGPARAGNYSFRIGTAGSATLVLQTVLPPLLLADGASTVAVVGGTYNDQAPPYDFLAEVFFPLVNRMGPRVSAKLECAGFYPHGGGRIVTRIEPASRLVPLELGERPDGATISARALVSRLPLGIALRELAVVRERLSPPDDDVLVPDTVRGALGPGNVLLISVRTGETSELFSAVGRRGVPSEEVAAEAVGEAESYLASRAAVGEHLADQLLLPLAMAGGGSFTASAVSLHATTNMEVIREFLPVEFASEAMEGGWRITCRPRPGLAPESAREP